VVSRIVSAISPRPKSSPVSDMRHSSRLRR
jgi:hypothetical protein